MSAGPVERLRETDDDGTTPWFRCPTDLYGRVLAAVMGGDQ